MKMKKYILAAAMAFMAFSASAQQKWGVVDFSANYMRREADFDAPLETQALMGSVVEITGDESYWLQIKASAPEYTAWAHQMGIYQMSEDELKAYIESPKYICTAEYTYLYDRPSSFAGHVCDLVMGDLVCKMPESGKKILGDVGFYKVQTPSGRTGYVKALEFADFSTWAARTDINGKSILKTADKFLGVPYFWGGNSIKGVDCSGLSWSVYFMNGIILPRNCSQQVKCGAEVPLFCLEPGDLLFFGKKADGDNPEKITHVAIYLGDTMMMHASGMVRINSIDPSKENYYEREILHARRILGHVDDGTGAVSVKASPAFFTQGK